MAKVRESLGDRTFVACVYTIVLLIVLIVFYPLVYVLSCSISSPTLVATGKVWLLPQQITFMGYQRVFQDPQIMTGYGNTLIYTLFGTIINLAVTVPAGYVLSKKTLPMRNFLTFYFLFIMYFSGGMIPSFLLIKSLGLYNTRLVLIILGAFAAYDCIICRTFFSSVPQELEDAALIDGCTPIRTFIQVVLPVSQALLGVMVLYFAVGHWNSFFPALIYTMDSKIIPLQLVLRKILILEKSSAEMMSESDTDLAALKSALIELIKYSVIVVSSIPLLILYPFLQKYFVKGVMIGSLKG